MNVKDNIRQKLDEFMQSQGIDISYDVSVPKDPTHGGFTTNFALVASRQLKQSPIATATRIRDLFKDEDYLSKTEIAGPGFLNFYINQNLTKALVNNIISSSNYGESKSINQKWLIEHTSPNPNKSMHLGHLRNNVTGVAIANIARAAGAQVTVDAIDNNRGIAIAKLMWGYLKFANKDQSKQIEDIKYWFEHQSEWMTPEEAGLSSDKFMDGMYVKGSEDFKNPEVEQKVRQLVVDWEAEDNLTWELWKTVLDYVYQGQAKTLSRLGSNWDHVWHEHEHYKEGKEIVEQGLSKGIFIKLPDGAIVTNLKEYKIPDTIVIKKDGTSLYITQDLALTKKKIDKFNPDKIFWVIGPEQSLAMKQVFAVSNQLGFGPLEKFNHIAYGFISIKGQGKMSSRAGNVIYIDDLLDEARDSVMEKIKNDELTEDQKREVAEKVGIAAVKYSILKVGRTTDTAFDFDTSLSFEGDSGPYLMYSYARCASILRQYEKPVEEVQNFENIYNTAEEVELLRILNNFPEVVKESANNYAPNLVCSYLFELAQSFNKFYNQHSVLKAENEELVRSRVILTKAISIVIKKGLSLLGIDTVEAM